MHRYSFRLMATAALLALFVACDSPPAQPATTTDVVTTTTSASTPPPRTVRPSPEVLALLEPDPDLEATMTPEEIRATLNAAANTGHDEAPSARLPNPSVSGDASAEMRRLEGRKDERDRDYRKRLESTTVYKGPDGLYHGRGCPLLNIRQIVTLPNGTRVERVQFIGIATTLAGVIAARDMAHGVCSPPAVEY